MGLCHPPVSVRFPAASAHIFRADGTREEKT
jgi:hypothetical protein